MMHLYFAGYMAVSVFGTQWGQGLSREGTKLILFFLYCFVFYLFIFSCLIIYVCSALLGEKEREKKAKKKDK